MRRYVDMVAIPAATAEKMTAFFRKSIETQEKMIAVLEKAPKFEVLAQLAAEAGAADLEERESGSGNDGNTLV